MNEQTIEFPCINDQIRRGTSEEEVLQECRINQTSFDMLLSIGDKRFCPNINDGECIGMIQHNANIDARIANRFVSGDYTPFVNTNCPFNNVAEASDEQKKRIIELS